MISSGSTGEITDLPSDPNLAVSSFLDDGSGVYPVPTILPKCLIRLPGCEHGSGSRLFAGAF